MTDQPKKLIIVYILDILNRYSDENHRLSQKDIADILKNEYHIIVERKAIKRNIVGLMECGYNIEYSESVRMVPNEKTKELEERYKWSDFYLERTFTDSELRLLIDGLVFSRHIPYEQCRSLCHKLESLSSRYFRSRVKHIATMPCDKTDNKQLFLNIELLDEAVSRSKKVSFKYSEYGTDKKMHKKKNSDGSDRVYIISPYQMAARDGKYYLICNYDKYNDISNYRMDRFSDIEILEQSAKPFESLSGAGGERLDLNTYMNEHIYMFSSSSTRVKFSAARPMVTDVIEMFGKDIILTEDNSD